MSDLYSVFDRVASVYGAPFLSPNEGAAQRMLAYEVNAVETSMLFRSPSDFDLVRLGSFDSVSGDISLVKISVVCNLSSLKAPDAISGDANRAGTGDL